MAKTSDEAKGHFGNYSEYNRILRLWFVTFGFGVPATFLFNEKIAEELARQHELRNVAVLFIIGASAQVIVAFVNKFCSWSSYFGEVSKPYSKTCRYRFTNWLNEQFWIDVVLDILSIGVFGVGIWKVLTIFAKV
jgi:hypothetical protein